MAELPVTLPSVKVETESRVILQLPSDVQAALERKALDSKMTLTDFLATKLMRSFTRGLLLNLSLSTKLSKRNPLKKITDAY